MSHTSAFLLHVNQVVKIPESDCLSFEKLVQVRRLNKGEEFIRMGSYSQQVAYIRRGLLRYYYADAGGTQFTKGFFAEGQVLGALSAILEKRASYFTIEALEDAELEVIDFVKFESMTAQQPLWNQYLISVLKKAYLAKETREREFLLLDAEQRYHSFLNRYPGLEKRIKQHMIASYLGITPESLSRIKKRQASYHRSMKS